MWQSAISLQGLWSVPSVAAAGTVQREPESDDPECMSGADQPARGAAGVRGAAADGEPLAGGTSASLAAAGGDTLAGAVDDVLQLDAIWTFVGNKQEGERWLWTALCRRTRQIVAFFIGAHDAAACQQLWQRVPPDYAACVLRSDAWRAYEAILPPQQHRTVGKETGETAHQERWYNTLRQRLARFVRKTLSFSKSDTALYWWTLVFIPHHNRQQASLTL